MAGTERILAGICLDTAGTESDREVEDRESMLRLYLIANARVRLWAEVLSCLAMGMQYIRA